METICSDIEISDDIIRESFEELFPDLQLFKWDLFSDIITPEGYDKNNANHILFDTSLVPERIEFEFQIDIYRTPDKHSQERSIEIARAISKRFHKRIIIPYNSPENPRNPFYNLIFENGDIYLADDSDSNLADGTEGKVKLIRKVEIESFQFDREGNLIEEHS